MHSSNPYEIELLLLLPLPPAPSRNNSSQPDISIMCTPDRFYQSFKRRFRNIFNQKACGDDIELMLNL